MLTEQFPADFESKIKQAENHFKNGINIKNIGANVNDVINPNKNNNKFLFIFVIYFNIII
jgi:hypothetical protein